MVGTTPMKWREVQAALLENGCRVLRDKGGHEVWGCPCGNHITPLPHHTNVSAGVVRSIGKQMACLPKGWLQ